MRSRQSSRRRTVLVGAAATVSVALMLAGCASADKNTSGEGTPLPGITDTTVTIGWSITDIGTIAKSLGFIQPDYGGYEKQAKVVTALTDYINKNGGMGGRQVKAVIKKYDGSNDSPQLAEAQCKGFTQDDKVTAAVIDGGFQNNTIPCFASANTLIVMQSLLALDQKKFEQHSPYLWSPSNPEYSGFVKAQLDAMKTAKFFDGNTGVMIMPSDDEVSRRTTETVVEPYLKSIGITKMQSSYIDSTNTGTLGATAAEALTAGKNGKLNRVIVIGGARILPVALADQTAVGYDSTWGISTYDNPIFSQNNPESVVTELRVGMTGLGYAPAQDVDDKHGPAFPDPTNAAQVQCANIVNAAGATPPKNARNNWKNALLYCDAAMFLKAVFDQAPKGVITGADFKAAAAKIGPTYHSALTFGSQWGPDTYAGTNTARILAWSEACSCFDYTGGNVTFATTGGAASGAVPSVDSSVGGGAPSSVAPGTTDTTGTTGGTGGGAVPMETITVSP